jgi:hypothetical protein
MARIARIVVPGLPANSAAPSDYGDRDAPVTVIRAASSIYRAREN